MALTTVLDPAARRVFRLAYASRSLSGMGAPFVTELADYAASSNRRNRVSGVLFAQDDIFLQWLEGPRDTVCALMKRIEADPRHHEVSVLGSGWMAQRRYARWPMQLSDRPMPCLAPRSPRSSYDADGAMRAFDSVAEDHLREAAPDGRVHLEHAAFARALISASDEALPALPQAALRDLHRRAELADHVCMALAQGRAEDIWPPDQIAIALFRLNRLWQQAGRARDPVQARRHVAIAVPPGASEILGAIVKADLLRSEGVAVRMVLDDSDEAALDAACSPGLDAVIVAGPRAGPGSEARRAHGFALAVQARAPRRPVYLGGAASGPLAAWAGAQALNEAQANAHASLAIGELVQSALGSLNRQRTAFDAPRTASQRH
ncbi:BLUF domain-containing protein [Alkalicaulis satelles]|nr:BLUF domain-containing protein [Alkalicaulis satelles]